MPTTVLEKPKLKKVSQRKTSSQPSAPVLERPKLKSTGKLSNLDCRGSVTSSKNKDNGSYSSPEAKPTLRKSDRTTKRQENAAPSKMVKPVLKKVSKKEKNTEQKKARTDSSDSSLIYLLQQVRFGHEGGRLEAINKGVGETFVDSLCKDLTNIVHIDLSKNNLSESLQMKLIASVIRSNSVETLNLDGNDSISKKNSEGLGLVMPMNSSLTTLTAAFSKKPSGLESVLRRNSKIADYMTTIRKARGSMKSLSPRDNDLVVRILKVIDNHPSVTELVISKDIRFQHLSRTMVLDLAEAMKHNFYVKTMKITSVELGNAFLSSLASSLESNFCLETLDLRGNSITSEALLDFCKAMTKNKTLSKVNLTKMHSPILTHDEDAALKALLKNSTLTDFRVEFRTPENEAKLEKALSKNKKQKLSADDFDKALLAYLKKEAAQAKKLLDEREADKDKETKLLPDDWSYLYELSQMADIYNTLDNAYEEEDTASGSPKPLSMAPKKDKMSMSKLKQTMDTMSADGSFLTEEYISKYIVENKESGAVIFEFTNQFKMFKRFQIGDKARAFIVKKFVDVLLAHSRASDFTHLHMANINCSDDLLERLSEKCSSNPKLLKKLHLINLETNNISGPGAIAMANCLQKGKSLRYLQTLKLENQTSLMKTEAEEALAKGLLANRSVIRLGLRVRNLLERDRIGRYLQRNMDLLRQARREHAIKTGKSLDRPRNKMEKFIDSVAANDSTIKVVEIVGDPLFLGLNSTEVLKAGKSFANNSHVKRVKLCNLSLDDKFALELGKALPSCKVEYLCLDSNAMSGEGIKAIVQGLAGNKTVTEFQIRHQRKTMAAADEERIADLLGSNVTIVKMGVDFRSHSARTKLERKIAENVATQRKARSASRATSNGAVASSSAGKIRSDDVQKLFRAVAENDKSVSKVELDNDPEFLQMEKRDKQAFYDSLKKNKTVNTLSLKSSQLDNGFADDMALALAKNKTLIHLSFDNNDFTSPGVLAIALASCQRKNVKSLSIMRPRFKLTNEHAEEFLKAMEAKSYLTKCEIEFREESHKQRLAKVLKSNK